MYLDTLFNPKSVAVIGVSANPSKWGNWMAEQVLQDESLRRIYLVSSRGEIIFGKQTLTSISQIPERLDVAIVAVPNAKFEDTIDQLLAHGTKIIIGITVGFGETGHVGLEIQKRIVEKVRLGKSFLVGPNCAGLWCPSFRCFPIATLSPGRIGLISQSGGVITDVALRLEEVKMGFSKVVSVGNQAQIPLGDLIMYLNDDPSTDVIAMYIEDEPSIPYHVWSKISKPIVLLTPDTTTASRRAASYHTNSSLWKRDLVRGTTLVNGRYYAETIQQFVALIQATYTKRNPSFKRTVILTDTGGLGVLAAGVAERQGLRIQLPTEQLIVNLKKNLRLLPRATISNPIDLISIPGGFSQITIDTLRTLQCAEDVDAILMILFLIEDQNPIDQYNYGLQLAAQRKKPTVFVVKNLQSPGAQALLEQKCPVYRDVELAIGVINTLCG